MGYMLFLYLYIVKAYHLCNHKFTYGNVVWFILLFFPPPHLPLLFSLYTVLPSFILATFLNPNPKSNPNTDTNTSHHPLHVIIHLSARSFTLWFYEISLSHLPWYSPISSICLQLPKFYHSLWWGNIQLYIYIPQFLYPFINWRTSSLVPQSGYGELSSNERWCRCISVLCWF